jgi:hypothetical protein
VSTRSRTIYIRVSREAAAREVTVGIQDVIETAVGEMNYLTIEGRQRFRCGCGSAAIPRQRRSAGECARRGSERPSTARNWPYRHVAGPAMISSENGLSSSPCS